VIVAESRALLPDPWHTITTSAFRPDAARRAQLWQTALPEAPAEQLADLAQRFPLTAGGVFRAADEARARGGGDVEPDVLAQAAREQLEVRSSLAERSRSTKRLADLVAQPQTVALIEEIIAFAHSRRQVFDDWGFGRRMRGGLKVLFSGPPGTGKTLSAEIISGELELDLYRIDVSNVVSKWIGETEKNLKQVFDQAEAHGGVLLFDEADALFGKRASDVKSSTDRYANLEVNYLLQRMEGYEGIVLLTTNLETGIDEAFRRRLNFRVRFLAPDVDEREQLWQLMIPSSVPRGEALDFAEVAERYDMPGGNIKNAALRAAILAAAEGSRLMTRHLCTAAEREFTEIGRISK
jgi:SpoVK/Ycf46/Vps4 family AAA+-type ATPase